MGIPKGHQHEDPAPSTNESDPQTSTPRRGYLDSALADIADALERELDGDDSDNWLPASSVKLGQREPGGGGSDNWLPGSVVNLGRE